MFVKTKPSDYRSKEWNRVFIETGLSQDSDLRRGLGRKLSMIFAKIAFREIVSAKINLGLACALCGVSALSARQLAT